MDKLLCILALNVEYDDNCSYRRILLISIILMATVFVFVLFSFVNAVFLHNYIVASLDAIAALVSIYAIYNLKKYNNVPLAAKLATFNLMFFFLTFIYLNGASHFSLIWTIFLPIFAILTNGKRIGLYFSILFYAVLFTMAYSAIEVWNNGTWLIQDWLRLVVASSMLTFVIYMNESALEASDIKLAEIRENEKAHLKELKSISITDQLTGLYNRRYYNEMLPKLISLAKRKEHYITFFILDIDFFKNYNDHYGHLKGDGTLIKVAHAIRDYIHRGDDFVFRLGGEEFAGVILSDDSNKTHKWISSLCEVIENLKIEHADSNISEYVTASIGVATISHEKNKDMDTLYHFADEALYLAKNGGRNRMNLSDQSA
ncbi:MAG: GGDEF domain-containing protein [Campylobacterota bacterium]|nr:GGDEF domain-containing protein [Campylobacterota bacterium]